MTEFGRTPASTAGEFEAMGYKMVIWPLAPPQGCAFHPRCPYAVARCREERPALRPVDAGHVACHRTDEIA